MTTEQELFAAATKIDIAAAVKHIRDWRAHIDDHHRQMYADLIEAQAQLISWLVEVRQTSALTIRFTRCFAMPNAETFSVKPIGEFVQRFLVEAKVSVDPFARNRDWATYTNDIDMTTSAQSHQDAEKFLYELGQNGVLADLAIFDPPYSPRQISEHYRAAGLSPRQEDTQNGRLYKRVRDAMDRVVRPGGVVLSFGWQSAGMGIGRGYELFETMLVAHGGGHNDTICIAERKLAQTTPKL